MTCFRNSAEDASHQLQVCAVLLAGLLVAGLCGARDSAAQESGATGPPRGLTDRLRPSTDDESQAIRTLPARPGAQESAIDIGVLNEAGAPGERVVAAEGGFSADFWQGSERLALEYLFGTVRIGHSSPTLQSLTRRLLRTGAPFPAGVTSGRSLEALRLALIFESGDVAGLDQMAVGAGNGIWALYCARSAAVMGRPGCALPATSAASRPARRRR